MGEQLAEELFYQWGIKGLFWVLAYLQIFGFVV
jgi:hypothetical protein